jgi:hypothetical protein
VKAVFPVGKSRNRPSKQPGKDKDKTWIGLRILDGGPSGLSISRAV